MYVNTDIVDVEEIISELKHIATNLITHEKVPTYGDRENIKILLNLLGAKLGSLESRITALENRSRNDS